MLKIKTVILDLHYEWSLKFVLTMTKEDYLLMNSLVRNEFIKSNYYFKDETDIWDECLFFQAIERFILEIHGTVYLWDCGPFGRFFRETRNSYATEISGLDTDEVTIKFGKTGFCNTEPGAIVFDEADFLARAPALMEGILEDFIGLKANT